MGRSLDFRSHHGAPLFFQYYRRGCFCLLDSIKLHWEGGRKPPLIAINYDDALEQDIERLRFPQCDLRKMRKLLKGSISPHSVHSWGDPQSLIGLVFDSYRQV